MSRSQIAFLTLGIFLFLASVSALVWHYAVPPAVSTYTPHDPTLRHPGIYLFRSQAAPQTTGSASARAFVWLYGNDVAFWRAHQELAARFADHGYDVTGFDARRLFDALPQTEPQRDSIVADTIASLLSRARHEFGDDTLPVILAGHSLGADFAVWTAVHVRVPRLAGLLLLSPTRRSHLYATVRDRAFLGEPTEAGSYAVADLIPQVPAGIPIVVGRGDNDRHQDGDSALVATIVSSGHARNAAEAYRLIPFSGHSLHSLIIAGPVIEHALDDVAGQTGVGSSAK